jgi:hypothetical protein
MSASCPPGDGERNQRKPVLLTIAKRVMQRRRNVVMFHNVVYPDD